MSIFQWAKYTAILQPDIISGHDMSGWTIGWLSQLYNRKYKPILVYASHEFELGRNSKRSKLKLWIIKRWEKKILKDSAFTIVVNDSIADELVKIYKLKERPIVIRSIPEKWDIDQKICLEKRREIEGMFGMPRGGYIIMYHGNLGRNRGLEQLLSGLKELADVYLILLGNFESEQYKNTIQKYISGIEKRVLVKGAVQHTELWKYVGAVDLSVAPIIPKYRSYYYCLPNKLFESIQAGTPLLVSDLPEMRKIVRKYGVGECMNPENMQELKDKILEMKSKGRNHYQDALIKASEELTWNKEKIVLKKVYLSIMEK